MRRFLFVFSMFDLGSMGLKLFQNGELRSPDILQYFLDDFGNFEIFVKIWTRSPPNYLQITLKLQEKYWNIIGKYGFENLRI